jgi:phosphate:Na+ symporter
VSVQVVMLALGFQLCATLILLVVRNRVFDFIESRFPPSTSEVLSETEYLHERAADSPDTALLLLEKEQFRLMKRLPSYIDYVRLETSSEGKANPDAFHAAFQSISAKIGETLSSISRKSLSTLVSDRLIQVAKLQEQLVTLEGYVYQLTCNFKNVERGTKTADLGRNILESVDFMVLTAIDAIESQSEGEVETLALLTQDRSEMMTRILHNYFTVEGELKNEDRNFVLDITMLLENVVHTLARYGQLLEPEKSV